MYIYVVRLLYFNPVYWFAEAGGGGRAAHINLFIHDKRPLGVSCLYVYCVVIATHCETRVLACGILVYSYSVGNRIFKLKHVFDISDKLISE